MYFEYSMVILTCYYWWLVFLYPKCVVLNSFPHCSFARTKLEHVVVGKFVKFVKFVKFFKFFKFFRFCRLFDICKLLVFHIFIL